MTPINAQPVTMDAIFWAATVIFVVAYAVIVMDWAHKTAVALAGASLMIALGVLGQHEAFNASEFGVDWNVIFLLISMMIIVNLMRPTGVFEYVAIKSAQIGCGNPMRILLILSVVTAILSALLDNVTTVLLIAPVALLIAGELEVSPVPYLISCALASNIGGTATLIGDPPNIMIASRAGLSFMDFIVNVAPVAVISLAVFMVMAQLMWGRQLRASEPLKCKLMAMDAAAAIKDRVMLARSLVVLTAVLAGFVLHRALHYEPASVALFGAAIMMLISRERDDLHRALADVEWPTIFFFIGLFIIVGGAVKVGLITWLSAKALALTQGNMFGTSMLVLWFSAFASAIVDNIPYVATMNPLIADMAARLWPGETGVALLQHKELMPVWWSLALGACLGGNGTAIGASANVIVVGMAERAGYKLSFLRFMLYGVPVMLMSVGISAVYIWLRYYF